MPVRVIAALWVVFGIAIWNGFNDIYVSRGAHEFAKLRLEHELGRGPEPEMADVMGRARQQGRLAGSLWAGLSVAAGLGTLWIARRRTPRS